MSVQSANAEITAYYDKLAQSTRALSTISDEDVDIATAPKTEVLAMDKMRLYRYEPTAPVQVATPLLIVYSQIGRYTMMDLQPDRSLVRNLLARGIEVYMIDWGDPSRADQWLTFGDYVEEYVGACVEAIRDRGAEQVSLLGVCQGGVFAACYAALNPDRVERLALAVTPIDFHADAHADGDPSHGYFNRWARNFTSAEIRKLIDSFGQLPGEVTGAMFQLMTPVKSATKYTWDLPGALSGDRDQVLNFLRMEKWLSDRPHHPGAAAHQWLVDLYKENRLVKGTFKVDGQAVRLGNLTMPVLNVFASRDHIVPPPTSRGLAAHVGTDDYRELELGVGHIGTFVSRRANRQFSDTLADWLAEGMAARHADAA